MLYSVAVNISILDSYDGWERVRPDIRRLRREGLADGHGGRQIGAARPYNSVDPPKSSW